MEWISVKDRLPEHGQDVIVYGPDGVVAYVTYMANDNLLYTGFYFDVGGEYITLLKGITHWMPLPEPPNKQ